MTLREGPLALWTWPAAILVAALLVLWTDPGGFASHLRNIEFDAYQYSKPRAYEDPHEKTGLTVRTLDVDAASLAKFGPWPWPRATLAKLTSELKDAGASFVVFAFPLDQPDAASPKVLLGSLPSGPETDNARAVLAKMPSPDDALARAMASTHAVTGFVLGDAPGGKPPGLRAAVTLHGNSGAWDTVTNFSSAAGVIDTLESASSGEGALNLPVDKDGKLRAFPFVFRLQGKPVLTADIETVRLANAASSVSLDVKDAGVIPTMGKAEIGTAHIGEIDTPLTGNGDMLIYFTKNASRAISAAALDDKKIAASTLKNAIVYLMPPDDVLDTPLGTRSVADIRAEAVENILLGTALTRPDALGAELLFTLLSGALITFLVARLNLAWGTLGTIVLVAAAQVFTWTMFANSRLLVDSLGPSLALIAVLGAGGAASAREFANTRSRLRRAFVEALPAAVLERIARKPSLLRLDGETRTVTYLSCSIRDFGKLATSFLDDPHGFTKLVRRVTGPLLDEVTRHGGTIDRVSSDGFSAFWNAPLDDPEHAIHACEAANAMTEALAHANDQIGRERRIDGTAIDPIEIGIGISTGQAVAGGFGARESAAYSVTGDPPVMAEKVRALSQQYGPAAIVSEETRKEAARGFAFLEVDYIAAGPRDEPVKLYALLGSPLVRASPKFRAMTTFHDHIFSAIRSQQWAKARELIEQSRKLSGASQRLYDLHLSRVQYFEDNPPDAEWDGAFRTVLK